MKKILTLSVMLLFLLMTVSSANSVYLEKHLTDFNYDNEYFEDALVFLNGRFNEIPEVFLLLPFPNMYDGYLDYLLFSTGNLNPKIRYTIMNKTNATYGMTRFLSSIDMRGVSFRAIVFPFLSRFSNELPAKVIGIFDVEKIWFNTTGL